MVSNRYQRTAARKAGRPGRETRPKSITIDIHSHIFVPAAHEAVLPHLDLATVPLAHFATPETKELNKRQDADRPDPWGNTPIVTSEHGVRRPRSDKREVRLPQLGNTARPRGEEDRILHTVLVHQAEPGFDLLRWTHCRVHGLGWESPEEHRVPRLVPFGPEARLPLVPGARQILPDVTTARKYADLHPDWTR